ncbi:uncharacterized protein LOC132742953 [Ruditapes philippinarum]|uniref:uncharacterized protein LOC132742953 n=1 Tax=Ruditapes philippinarum TaxID=129788 RepID=UPI00295A67B8|nr:uncharacterized protein LOC132742953 [Ruditapes philippinarum]
MEETAVIAIEEVSDSLKESMNVANIDLLSSSDEQEDFRDANQDNVVVSTAVTESSEVDAVEHDTEITDIDCHSDKNSLDSDPETGDGQFVADAKKTDPPISDVGEGESEKEEYEDAHEADNASDLKTSPELSQSTADNDSFYDADEDRKQE